MEKDYLSNIRQRCTICSSSLTDFYPVRPMACTTSLFLCVLLSVLTVDTSGNHSVVDVLTVHPVQYDLMCYNVYIESDESNAVNIPSIQCKG